LWQWLTTHKPKNRSCHAKDHMFGVVFGAEDEAG
jgi:hypothetical protein